MHFLETDEIEAVVNRLLDNLALTITSQTGETGIELRYKIGMLRSNISGFIVDGTFSSKLLECFTAVQTAGATLLSLTNVRQGLFDEDVEGDITAIIVDQAIIFCLSTESRLITTTEFVSRDDVEATMTRMRLAFDEARDIICEVDDPAPYQALLALGGSLMNHLSATALQLPRVVTFKLSAPFPALTASQMIYYEPDRWEELIDENQIVHPAFCSRELRGLSR